MDLQFALIVIGVAIVAIVAVTAFDRERLSKSFRRLGMSTGPARREPFVQFDASIASPLEPEQRFLRTDVETPVVAPVASPRPDPVTEQIADLEQVANQPLNLNPGFDPPGTGPENVGKQAIPNDAIDFIMHLPGPGPVRRRSALAVYKQNEYKLEFPRQLYGQRYQTNFWSVLQYDSEATQYGDLKLAIQLVDHRGPINESELNAFVQVGLQLADALHRPSKFSIAFEQAVERAGALAAFYDEHDVIAGINIVTESHTPFKGRALLSAMQNETMRLESKNIFHKRLDGRLLYSLSNMYKPGYFEPDQWDDFRTPGVTLFMSVPCVSEPAVVFGRMMETAKNLSKFLGGQLLDQDRKPFTDKGIAAIRAQIHGIDAKMRAFGIAPGSDAAMRLFGADL
jgi:cell division protein ZipA